MHLLVQCISNKSGGWDQFSTQLGCGIVCLSKGLTYNFSKFMFDNMIENIEKQKHKFLMYHRFLQIILDITTVDKIHVPIKSLGSKLFASMQTNYAGIHFPLLPAMLPLGNDNLGEEDVIGNIPSPNVADDGNPSSSGIAADGHPSVVNEGEPIETTEPLPVSPDQPPHSPVTSLPSPFPTPTHDALDELTPEVAETIQSPSTHVPTPLESEFHRQPTPSPIREQFVEGSPNVVQLTISPERFNEAPMTNEQSVGGAENPVTLTSVHDLLCRYIKKTDDLQKELATTKSILGGEIEVLKKKVQDLEAQLTQQKKRKIVSDSAEVHKESNLDSLEILAEAARQTHSSSPKVVEASKSKPIISFSRRSGRNYLAKKVAASSKDSGGNDIPMVDQSDILQQTEHIPDIAAESTKDGSHISVDTFFVAGKEYTNSPSPAPLVPTQVSTEHTTETLHASGSLTSLDDQDISADPMEEEIIHDDDPAKVNAECADIPISEKERLDQAKLLQEWEDYKKSSDLAKAEQARYDSEIQSATKRYVSTLPIERQRELDAAIPNFDESDWQNIGAQVIATPGLATEFLGENVHQDDWASGIVQLMKQRHKAEAEKIAKAKRDKPMTQAQQKEYMRTYVKSQSSSLYNSAWSKKQVWALPFDKLVQMYNTIKARNDKAGMGASKNIPHVDFPVDAEKISLPDTSAGMTPIAAPSVVDKGKAKVVAEDIPSRKRTRKQMEEERLGEEAAKRLHDDQLAEMARFHELKAREVEPAAAKAKQMRKELDEQYASATLENLKDSTDEHLDIPSVEKNDAEDISTEDVAPEESSISTAMYLPGRRAKRMARVKSSHSTQRLIDVYAPDDSFVKEGSPDEWPEGFRDILVHWEVSKNGNINTIYRYDKTTLSFTFLQEILHLVDHEDLITLNELVQKYYATHTPTGSGMYLLGDLRVLFDSSTPDGAGYDVWKNNQKWKVKSWKFYPLPYVHVLETTTGIRVLMFISKRYPLSGSLMEKMLQQKVEIPPDPIGNARLFAESLVKLFKQRIMTSRAFDD